MNTCTFQVFIAFLVVEALVAIPVAIFIVYRMTRTVLTERKRTFATFMCLPRAAVVELAQRPVRVGFTDEEEEEEEDDDDSECTPLAARWWCLPAGFRPLCGAYYESQIWQGAPSSSRPRRRMPGWGWTESPKS